MIWLRGKQQNRNKKTLPLVDLCQLFFNQHSSFSLLSTFIKKFKFNEWYLLILTHLVPGSGPLAQSAERGADNAKVVSSTLTRTTMYFFFSI